MRTTEKLDDLLDEAKTMYALGHDNKYIEFQFAEKGINDELIDKIIGEINSLRKSSKRNLGFKMLIYGASFIVVGFIFTLLSYHSESPMRFILWGLVVSGVLTMAKGMINIIGW
jgi:hypothetical protein